MCDKLLRCECGNGQRQAEKMSVRGDGVDSAGAAQRQEGDCELEGAHTGEQCLQF